MDLTFYGSQYGFMGNSGGEVQIVDAIEGIIIDTGIRCDDIEYIANAGESYFAVVYKTREIAILEKSSGSIIKRTKEKIKCPINNVLYKDDMLYIETWYNGDLVFVVSDFE